MGGAGPCEGSDYAGPRAGSALQDSSERTLALRNLKRMHQTDPRVQIDEEFVARYLALRAIRGHSCRITPQMLLGCEPVKSKKTSLRQKLWIVSKTRSLVDCVEDQKASLGFGD